MTLEQYGLSAHPFQLTPDPRFWFESATHKKAMAYLGYGLQQGEGFVVITGEVGAGKTTLVGHLMNRLDPARVNAIRIVSSQVEGDDLLRLIVQGLGVNAAGLEKAQLLGVIEAALNDRARAGQRSLLIVDEGQALAHSSLEELRMLSNFLGRPDSPLAGRPLVQMMVLGQPEFRAALNTPELAQFRQRIIASHHLTGMALDEVGPYLVHRMTLCDWQGRPGFAPEALPMIFDASGGIPRKVNSIAGRALMMASLEQGLIIDQRIISLVVAELELEAPKLEANNVGESTDPALLDAAARLAMLEAQVAEQDAALRRMLNLLVDWVEDDKSAQPRMAMPAA